MAFPISSVRLALLAICLAMGAVGCEGPRPTVQEEGGALFKAGLEDGDLPQDVQSELESVIVGESELNVVDEGGFEYTAETIFCVFEDGLIPSSSGLLRELEHPYKTTSGSRTYKLIRSERDCSSTLNSPIYVAVISKSPTASTSAISQSYQLHFVAWQRVEGVLSAIFAAVVSRSEPREDAIGSLDAFKGEVSDLEELKLKMGRSASMDLGDQTQTFATHLKNSAGVQS